MYKNVLSHAIIYQHVSIVFATITITVALDQYKEYNNMPNCIHGNHSKSL